MKAPRKKRKQSRAQFRIVKESKGGSYVKHMCINTGKHIVNTQKQYEKSTPGITDGGKQFTKSLF